MSEGERLTIAPPIEEVEASVERRLAARVVRERVAAVLAPIVVIVALISDALVFQPLRRATAPTLMIASFAVSYVIQNGILMVYGARP